MSDWHSRRLSRRQTAATELQWRRMPLLQWPRPLPCRRSLLLLRAATCTGRSRLPPRPRLIWWPRRPRRRARRHRASSRACTGTRPRRSGKLESVTRASRCTFARATIFLSHSSCRTIGSYSDEADAARAVDQRCTELGRPAVNAAVLAGTQKSKAPSSIFRGVHWDKASKKWMAQITHRRKQMYVP